jgi:tRNA(fMet)-specific endonuclease VapC
MTHRYLLDTGIAGDMIHGRKGVPPKARAARLRGATIGTIFPVVGELYYGVEKSSTRAFNLAAVRDGLRRMRFWPFDRRAAEVFGRLVAEMERAGRQMQVVDVQLAAVALSLGNCTVVSSDSDLLAVPGLTVENWAA